MQQNKPNLRRQRCILVWDTDWQYKRDRGVTGGYIFRQGIKALQEQQQASQESVKELKRKIQMLAEKYQHKHDQVIKLRQELAHKELTQ
jgi:hypothetical protein